MTIKKIFFLFVVFYSISFSKLITINFNFDINNGYIYYKNLHKPIHFYNSNISLEINQGEYVFIFSDQNYNTIYKKINISHFRSYNINFSAKESINITGSVYGNNIRYKNINLGFEDYEGREFSTKCDDNGSFSVSLPIGVYKIYSKTLGYSIINNKKIFISSKSNSHKLNIKIKSSSSPFKIKIIDENMFPLINADIELKNNDSKIKLHKTNNLGIAILNIKPGIIFLEAKKNGYSSKIFITNLNKNDDLTTLTLKLLKKYYFINGTIVNDVFPAKNLPIYFFSKSGLLLEKIFTDSNGNFNLKNCFKEDYYIYIPESNNFKEYRSIIFDKNENTENIILYLEND